MLHIALHFLVPALISVAVALWQSPNHVLKRACLPFLLMMSTMVVDLDHLLATPIYDPNRCSIGFHPLHEPLWWVVYVALLYPKKTRWLGLGLCLHMGLDAIDCQMTNGIWITP